jgi:alkylhydroperoxidase family enzyme
MAWIRLIRDDEATGVLAREYKAAIARTGKVFGVLRVQGLMPKALEKSTGLYRVLMHGDGPLRRDQREMIATVVSWANGCAY